jgi:hypothetical protein
MANGSFLMDHQRYAISDMPSAISHQPSAISHQPSAISHQPSAISHDSVLFSCMRASAEAMVVETHSALD